MRQLGSARMKCSRLTYASPRENIFQDFMLQRARQKNGRQLSSYRASTHGKVMQELEATRVKVRAGAAFWAKRTPSMPLR
jgi:hypothetical protein